ncbi:hypothetical protein NFI96_024356 [Prochilodus magdalenae]|nr:hypothetical protein NFI96_024356 [Prochilodus magdalenae]
MSAHRWTRLCVLGFLSNSTVSAPSARKPVSKIQPLLWRNGVGLARRYCGAGNNWLNNEAVRRHLNRLLGEYIAVSSSLQSEALGDSERRTLNRRVVELSSVADTFQSCELVLKEMAELEAHLQSASDGDKQLVELLREEQHEMEKKLRKLNRKLIQTLVPSDVHDDSGVLLEVAAGRTTGGDICQQFTREMFEMYECFSSYKDWDFKVLNYTPSDYGGLHHAAVNVTGQNVYRWLKFEGGTHRVQRIPEVGLSSRMQRIHTGTMTVIVLPQPRDVDIAIDPKELRIDTFRSRGAGGQSVNTTDSAVRIVHLPTGTVAECQQSRSQLQNRDTALHLLKARLYQGTLSRQVEERHTARKQQMGTRSQSERIRTYNFSQDRVTDHRIGYVTRDIKEFMSGGEQLEQLISELQEHAETEALLELVKNTKESHHADGSHA